MNHSRLSQDTYCILTRRPSPRHTLLPSLRPHYPQIQCIPHRLNAIQCRLRSRKSILRVPCRKPVDVVYGSIEGIGFPNGGVQRAARHAIGPEEDVASVPKDQRKRYEEPEESQVARGMGPGLRRTFGSRCDGSSATGRYGDGNRSRWVGTVA